MSFKQSPWIAMKGLKYMAHSWFWDMCLRAHFDVPLETKEIKFHLTYKKTLESLRIEKTESRYDFSVTNHHNKDLDQDLVSQMMDFTKWFGNTKACYVWVEWR